jgi:hypothetical protein
MSFIREILIVLLCLGSITALAKETRKMVAVVDTGVPNNPAILKYMCRGGHVDLTLQGLKDVNGHGTNIIGLIMKGMNPATHCIVAIKYYHDYSKPFGKQSQMDVFNALYAYLLKLQPAYVNFSSSGFGFNYKEFSTFSSLMERGTKVVVAAGNNQVLLDAGSCDVFPACYFFNEKNFFVVGSTSKLSNYGGPVKYIRDGIGQCALGVCMNGTSQAAANLTAELLKGESRAK